MKKYDLAINIEIINIIIFNKNYSNIIKNNKIIWDYIIEQTAEHIENYPIQKKITWVLSRFYDFPKCEICGKPLLNLAGGFRIKTCLKRQGILLENCDAEKIYCWSRFCNSYCAHQSPNTWKKVKNTLQNNFGENVDNCFQLESVKLKAANTKKIKYGDEKFVNVEKAKKTNLEKYGVEYIFKNPVFIQKSKETFLKKYGVSHFLQNSTNRKIVRSKYFYNNIYFDSAPELAFFIYLSDNNIEFEYHPNIRFEYFDKNGISHIYFPDFKVGNDIYEIKGDYFFREDGKLCCPFDNKYDDNFESKHQCMIENNVIILRNSDYKKYLDYVSNKYGKKYLKQFKNKK